MHRFFVSADRIDDIKHTVLLDKEQSHHIEKVLRLKEGEKIILFDGGGKEFYAIITGRGERGLRAEILETKEVSLEPPIKLTLIQGIAKGGKMDTIIQKAVEIGVSTICPVLTENTVVALNGDKMSQKLKRWSAIAAESCKQCRRNEIPAIKPVMGFNDILKEIAGKFCIMLYEKGTDGIKKILLDNHKLKDEIHLIIGPEGGFTESEVNIARQHGVFIAKMGPRILRTETAGLAASSIVLYEHGDLG